jgi:hypothetical protein
LVVQERPAVHDPHEPFPSHTLFVPQDVPPGLLPASTHTEAPVEHDVCPSLHRLGLAVQVTPAVQETQLPPESQTRFVPQLVPGGRAALSTQVCAPVEHDVMPVWQALPGLVEHDRFAVQDTQVCAGLHTRFVPQVVPVAFGDPLTQAEPPVEHEVTPS